MEQYLSIKAKHKEAILFFRLGDFYEMFYEDAKIGSKALGITLTSRAHGKAADVPLAGFPYHALDNYLTKMVKAGYRVAICEQVEDPKKAKTIVKREVLEVVTPGTALSDELLDSKRNNYLISVYLAENKCGISSIDISTGEFLVTEVNSQDYKEQILALSPSEILISETQYPIVAKQFDSNIEFVFTKREDWIFLHDYAYETLTEHFGTVSLKGFGCDDLDVGISAAGAIISYLKENQKSKLVHINQIALFSNTDYMIVDSVTRRNLELFSSMSSVGKKGTLISILDNTQTAMGGRMLVKWLQRPLRRVDEIRGRLNAVHEFIDSSQIMEETRETLRKVGDIERLLSKTTTGKANARDLNQIKNSLKAISEIKSICDSFESSVLAGISKSLLTLDSLVNEIQSALVDDPPLSIGDGGLFRQGYNGELDQLREIAYSGKDWIARLQKSERERTGIPSLKVNYNKVFGYYIEITKPHLSKVPAEYTRKQTLVGAERFITQELKEYEEKVLGAEEKIASLEYELFNQLRRKVLSNAREIQDDAQLIAQLDCLANFAFIAVRNSYQKPELELGNEIIIKDGRHPVVEKLLPHGEHFVPNDTKISSDADQILIITGPNMAGKSTYLRQVGLLVIMAQMGSFIPAKSAKIGLVDKVFTRVGASDNLAAGESTFLTEMNETANILNNATPNSLVLLDEIGRGTSTFDGLSIAWSVAEYLHNNSKIAPKTMFATHYHELTELSLILPRVKNYNVAVKEWGDNVVFLRKILEGASDRSYGIHVAKLAGLPAPVIERAREVLANLESEELAPGSIPKLAQHRDKKRGVPDNQLELFDSVEKSIRDKLTKIDLNNMTPIEAINELNELKKMSNGFD